MKRKIKVKKEIRNEQSRERDRYRILSYSFLTLILLYVGTSQYVIANGLGVGTAWQPYLTGPARLEVINSILRLRMKQEYRILEIGLLHPIKSCSNISLSKGSSSYSTECSQGRDWITFRAAPGKSLNNAQISFRLATAEQAEITVRRYITEVRIDKELQNIPYVYQRLIERTSSNVKLSYPFEVFNLSSYLAFRFGYSLIWIISTTLLVLFACQAFLFMISFRWQPEEVTEHFDNERSPPVTLIDDIANHFAIPLGFLGTVVSIWHSLENAETDYSSFIYIVDILKIAIFTTVLGLSTKILCLVRGYRSRVKKDESHNER